jgi:hypothetical protein
MTLHIPARIITLQVSVTVPAEAGESEVESAINAALDEPPCYWGDWVVGAATIISVERGELPYDELDDEANPYDELDPCETGECVHVAGAEGRT